MMRSIEAKALKTSRRCPPERISSTVSRNASNFALASGSPRCSSKSKPGCAEIWRDVFLRAPQQEGLEPRTQRRHRLPVVLRNGDLEAAPERRLGSEQTGLHEGKDRPEIAQRIFHGRAGQRQTVIGAQSAHDAGDLRGRVLRVLRLVENQRTEMVLRELFGVEPGQRVRGNHDVGAGDLFVAGGALAAGMEAQRAQRGRKA